MTSKRSLNLLLLGFTAVFIGYLSVWLPGPAAGLSFLGVELGEWIKFMGSLLLLNIPGKIKIVDSRWVGHRLLGGYASLRWSNNTRQYKRFPVLIDVE